MMDYMIGSKKVSRKGLQGLLDKAGISVRLVNGNDRPC
jgi:hypothetical protein